LLPTIILTEVLMRRALALAATCAALFAGPAAHAGATRTVSADYTGSGVDSPAEPIPAMYGDVSGQGSQAEAVTVVTRLSDRTVAIRMADRTGGAVLAAVVQHLGDDARSDVELGRVCTASRAPLRLAAPGKPLTLYLLAGSCPAGPSVPTTGTAELTFGR
jgi:hypothetical protein